MRAAAVVVLILLAGCSSGPSPEQLAADPALFLKTNREAKHWDEPAEPVRLVGPIYFVGTKGLGSFLITGSQGHILINSGMPGSGELIEKSIIKAGFNPKDIKLILCGHAHIDHVGGHAYLQKATGAKVAVVKEEVELIESGGKTDFQYGAIPEFHYEPVKVDHIFRDGDGVRLGDIGLVSYLTRGHTKGSTTFVVTVVAPNYKKYTVVFPDGTSVNPGYRLGANPSYPGIADDYRKTFAVLEMLKPDCWFTGHNEVYGFDEKVEEKLWIDREGYAKFVATKKAQFEAALKRLPSSLAHFAEPSCSASSIIISRCAVPPCRNPSNRS